MRQSYLFYFMPIRQKMMHFVKYIIFYVKTPYSVYATPVCSPLIIQKNTQACVTQACVFFCMINMKVTVTIHPATAPQAPHSQT